MRRRKRGSDSERKDADGDVLRLSQSDGSGSCHSSGSGSPPNDAVPASFGSAAATSGAPDARANAAKRVSSPPSPGPNEYAPTSIDQGKGAVEPRLSVSSSRVTSTR